jgi:hypothetical protein
MPAWMTSLLRELVPVPKLGAASTTSTSRPAMASARATARPTTPAPTTTASAASRGTPVARPRRRRRPLDTARRRIGSMPGCSVFTGETFAKVSGSARAFVGLDCHGESTAAGKRTCATGPTATGHSVD